MRIRELAEAVLYGTRLEDKLACAPSFTDVAPGPALLDLPTRPGRPAGLQLDAGPARKFPKRFERPEARGMALHFFANHELLAMELMALMLLRFPDAPPAFRAGIAQTIAEEQSHLRMYAERMRALGVDFGDVAVNGYFWRTMRAAKDPLEFVVQMSLTFEQANLDYCVHYRDLFTAAEDQSSADLLTKVYEDEIGHVKHGLAWFRRWREGEDTEWQAYLRHLPAPMTPARAKGPVLDIEGRRRAGLDEDFVRHLGVFSSSKGRRPRLYVFEPAMEDRLAGRAADRPIVRELAADLAPLMGLLAKPDDRLVLESAPRLEHLEHLEAAGLAFPEVTRWADVERAAEAGELAGDAPEAFVPWGFTPELASRASRLCGQTAPLAAVRKFSDKREAHRLLAGLLEQAPALGVAEDVVGDLAHTEAEVFECVQGRDVVVKLPFSASGRHRMRLRAGQAPTDAERAFVRRGLSQGALWVAPWLDRVRDLSTTLFVDDRGRIRIDRTLWLVNDAKGAYLGHDLEPFLAGMHDEDRRALNQGLSLNARLQTVAKAVGAALAEAGYAGPAGIDHFVYRAPDGQARLHPLVEINPRHTMGHVAHVVSRALASGVVGRIRHLTKKRLGQPFAAWAEAARAAHPVMRDHGGLREGLVLLTDPEVARHVLAVLWVGPRPQNAATLAPLF